MAAIGNRKIPSIVANYRWLTEGRVAEAEFGLDKRQI